MDEQHPADVAGSRVAACIGEPARARMLYCLLDGHARTSTELAIVAGVSASTASAHLARLRRERLVASLAQGKHRYYRLHGPRVAAALEALMVVAGESRTRFVPSTPNRLRFARTCYDHLAGEIAVRLHDRLRELGWISVRADEEYQVSSEGAKAFASLGVDVDAARAQRRRFAYACVDWSERRPHMAGALGAALLQVALRRRWVVQDLDSRALRVTRAGSGELRTRLGLSWPEGRLGRLHSDGDAARP
ncbi:MAG TPA: helix-turn-helix domain-containing protein [Steroidobacteraceae bacterium]|jgi:DNA-binding transcriptional ArsR family regulator